MKNGQGPDDELDDTRRGVRMARQETGTAICDADPWGDLRDFVTLSVDAEDEDDPGAAPVVVAIAWQFSQMRASLLC